jgi:alpha-galactosidase/6-phospho-beta-glucosidase family protein
MKITIIGGAGLRTPIIIKSILARQDRLAIHELVLMDIDDERLELIGALTYPIEKSIDTKFRITRTIDPIVALKDADFVITTFRVGGIESRLIDERVPLNHGILGQETTGAGGFAMGIRSIPVILDYVSLMHDLCPNAWLINFANPAGMLTEAVLRQSGWIRVVGICDGPASMQLVIAALLGANPEDVYLDYFGLNHLGWIKRVIYQNHDHLPDFMELIKSSKVIPGLPFDPELIINLGMIPNEYLYYYYYGHQAVNNILKAGESRGEQIVNFNLRLLNDLKQKYNAQDFSGMQTSYQAYLNMRGSTYMVNETGKSHDFSTLDPKFVEALSDEGYAGVALNLIEALTSGRPIIQILNVPNNGSINNIDDKDVVEIPALVKRDQVQPLVVGEIPAHCMGLIKQVKYYEHLTIEAAVEASYQKARLALTIHPLVIDFAIARLILDEYMFQHKDYFPELN